MIQCTGLGVPNVSAWTAGALKMMAIGHCCPSVPVLHPRRMESSISPL